MKNKFLVKIQMPIAGENEVLIYNKNRTIMAQIPTTKEIKKWMDGQLKKFAYVKYSDPEAEYTMLEIIKEAPYQSW